MHHDVTIFDQTCAVQPHHRDWGTCRVQSLDKSRAGLGGTTHCRVAVRGEAEQGGTLTGRSAQDTTVPPTPQSMVDNYIECFPGAQTNKVLCKPAEKQNPRLTCRVQKPDKQQAGQCRAAHGGRPSDAGRGGAGRVADGRFAQEITVPLAYQNIENKPPGRFCRSTNK